MAIHYKGMRERSFSRPPVSPCLTTATDNSGTTIVVEKAIKPLLDAQAYSPDYLKKHPDLMVTGINFDITSNETAEDIVNDAFGNIEINNLITNNNG